MEVAAVATLTTTMVIAMVPVVALGLAMGVAAVALLIFNVNCVTCIGMLLLFVIFSLMGIINQIPL